MDTSTMRYPFGRCWKCGKEFDSELRGDYIITHCPYCGTEIDDMFIAFDQNCDEKDDRYADIFCQECGLRIREQVGENWIWITRDKNPKQPGVCSGPCGRMLCAHCGDWDEEGKCPKCHSERPEYKDDVKTGWWKVIFYLHLDGEEVRFEDLSETLQEHILNSIRRGINQGQLVEDIEDEKPNPCDACGYDSEVACRDCCKKIN